MKAILPSKALAISYAMLVLFWMGFLPQGYSQSCPDNIGFENGNLNNWTFFKGSCCPISANTSTNAISGRHTLTSGTGKDYYGDFPVVAPRGGNYSLKLGNASSGGEAERARFYIRVPNGVNNYCVLLSYAVVLQNPSHTHDEQPRFAVRAFDSATGNNVSCANFDFVASGSLPGFTKSKVTSNVWYKPWDYMSMNLSGSAGKTIVIDFTTADCGQGGHFGYGYFDLDCGLFQIAGAICPNQKNVTLSAPYGFSKYEWYDSAFSKLVGTGQSISFPPPKTKTRYKVVITPYSGYGCKDTLESLVDFSYLKVDSISSDTFICYNKKLQLSAKASDQIKYYPLTEQWVSSKNTAACTHCNQLEWHAKTSDTFYYKVSNSQGCRDSARVVVKVNPMLQFHQNLEGKTACEGSRTVLSFKSNAFSDLKYIWYKNDVAIGNNSDSLVLERTALSDSGNYRVLLFNHCDTLSTNTAFLKVNPKTKIVLSATKNEFCETEALRIRQHIIGTMPFAFVWKKDNKIVTGFQTDSFYLGTTHYRDSGIYMAHTSGGCGVDSAKISIVIHPSVHANFEINKAAQCEKEQQFIFSDNSHLPWGKYVCHWSANSLKNSSDFIWKPVGLSAGVKKIKLVVAPVKGCADSIEKTIEIFASPVAKISANDSVSCFKEQNFIATDVSTITSGNTKPLWALDQQIQSSASNILEVKNLNPGEHSLELIAISEHGCSDTSQLQIVVHPSPEANYTLNDTQFCFTQQQFVFQDHSSLAYDEYEVLWRASEGSMSKDALFHPWFAQEGSVSVSQIITSENGCTDSNYIPIFVRENPKAQLELNDAEQCFNEQLFLFTDKSVNQDSQKYRSWYLDNTLLPDNYETLALKALEPGAHKITLVPRTQYQCEDTLDVTFFIHPNPKAQYTNKGLHFCEENQAFQIQDASILSEGKIQTKWKSGDGNVYHGPTFSHHFSTNGTFSAWQIVTSEKGCTDSTSISLIVHPKPHSRLSANAAQVCQNEQHFVLSDIGMDFSTKQIRQWNLNGKTLADTVKTIELPLLPDGKHHLQIYKYSEHGCMDSASFDFDIYPSPVAMYSANKLEFCINKQDFIFEDKSTISGGTFQTLWRMGDEASTPGNTIKKQYQKHGNYVVWQIVTSDKNCTDSVSIPVSVHPAPHAQIHSGQNTQCHDNQYFEFADVSSISNNTLFRKWQIDGASVHDTNARLIAPTMDIGKHRITLLSISEFGCTAADSLSILVLPNPIAKHRANDTVFCIDKQQFEFRDSSSIHQGSLRIQWNFGDGEITEGKRTSHEYKTAGRYRLTHIAGSTQGCADTSYSNVLVRPQPQTRFVIEDSLLEWPKFINLSSPGCTYHWDFGNGIQRQTKSTETMDDIIFDFNASRSYRTSLLVTDAYGCQDSTSLVVRYRGPYIFIPNAAILQSESRENSFFVSCFRCRNYTLKIFNRWGQMIYESPANEPFPVWNGQINGRTVMEGLYVYMVEARDYSGQAYYRNGTVYMMR